ncbi:MAG: hemerythrin domain-containing protein [Streptosporangiales bacterium]
MNAGTSDKDMIDLLIDDHREVESLFQELESGDNDPPRRKQLVSVMIAELVRHSVAEEQHLYPAARRALENDEENDLFPQLRQACSHDDLLALGAKLRKAKSSAPTRPHPKAPDEPPANKFLAPGAGLVDRVRDALTHRPTEPDELA